MLLYCRFTLLLGALVTGYHSIAMNKADAESSWAIAIHGGAGGSLAKLNEPSRQARIDGLTTALEAGRDVLTRNGTALEAVEAVIRILEDDPLFNAGRGAVITQAGHVELDASIMDGKTLACGAIASVTNVKNPITLARRVMSETKHVLLVGKGAEEFAAAQRVPLVDPQYFLSHARLPIDAPNRELQAEPDIGNIGANPPDELHYGTVGCVALDSSGNLAAGTSTGGTAKKLPGRVGDSPIIGAGTYAANDTCAISGTGVGEEYIRHSVAYDIAAQMRYRGTSLESAVTEIMQVRLKKDVGGLIAIARDGTIVMQHNTTSMACGAANSQGRFDVMLEVP